MAQKKSIRFWGDWQVRAVWDEVHSKWWFSAIDIVRAINDEDDYVKSLLSGALTDKIDDRETFMKGIDYSYYYEQTEQ